MDTAKHWINWIFTPVSLYVGSSILFIAAMLFMKHFVRWYVSGIIAVVTFLFFVFALFDDHFRHIVLKPDNIPITLMLVSVGYLTWYALRRGVENDERTAAGKPILEKEQSRRVMVWPNLVYIEFIALIALTVFLIVWSIVFQAPLEDPANPALTPNPSKAPWYFLGLQEMLVYFDPWLAGVVFPGLIVVGLMAIPYLDKNPKGSGYFSFHDRRFIIGFYLFGFVIQWVLLIMLGTFMRGPGWNFFAPFEPWDPHKVMSLTNVNFSELIWVKGLNTGLPGNILIREGPGFLLVLLYFILPPGLLAKFSPRFRAFRTEMGPIGYQIACFLFLSFLLLPVKMIGRWSINLKYIVAIPEYFFNI